MHLSLHPQRVDAWGIYPDADTLAEISRWCLCTVENDRDTPLFSRTDDAPGIFRGSTLAGRSCTEQHRRYATIVFKRKCMFLQGGVCGKGAEIVYAVCKRNPGGIRLGRFFRFARPAATRTCSNPKQQARKQGNCLFCRDSHGWNIEKKHPNLCRAGASLRLMNKWGLFGNHFWFTYECTTFNQLRTSNQGNVLACGLGSNLKHSVFFNRNSLADYQSLIL